MKELGEESAVAKAPEKGETLYLVCLLLQDDELSPDPSAVKAPCQSHKCKDDSDGYYDLHGSSVNRATVCNDIG